MLSALYYLLLVLLCTLFMILSALALVVCYPFDRGRRTVHELSRILVTGRRATSSSSTTTR